MMLLSPHLHGRQCVSQDTPSQRVPLPRALQQLEGTPQDTAPQPGRGEPRRPAAGLEAPRARGSRGRAVASSAHRAPSRVPSDTCAPGSTRAVAPPAPLGSPGPHGAGHSPAVPPPAAPGSSSQHSVSLRVTAQGTASASRHPARSITPCQAGDHVVTPQDSTLMAKTLCRPPNVMQRNTNLLLSWQPLQRCILL